MRERYGRLITRDRRSARSRNASAMRAASDLLDQRLREDGTRALDVWNARVPIVWAERERLWRRYREHLVAGRALRGIDAAAHVDGREQDSLDRQAISRALVQEGLLRYRGRWIPPPIRGRKASNKP